MHTPEEIQKLKEAQLECLSDLRYYYELAKAEMDKDESLENSIDLAMITRDYFQTAKNLYALNIDLSESDLINIGFTPGLAVKNGIKLARYLVKNNLIMNKRECILQVLVGIKKKTIILNY